MGVYLCSLLLMSIDKAKTPFFFKEAGMTVWLTASQYTRLKARFIQLADYGSPVAAARLQGFSPSPAQAQEAE